MNTFYIKKGENFKFTTTFKDSENNTIVVDEVTAQLRDQFNNLIANFEVLENEDTSYSLSLNDTTDFPIGNLKFDIRIKVNNDYIYTKTFSLVVIKNETSEIIDLNVNTLKEEVDSLNYRVQHLEQLISDLT